MHVGAARRSSRARRRGFEELLDHIRARLHLVPRYRQKLAVPAARDRPPAVGRRPDLQPRVPRAPDRAAGPGLARTSCCSLTARSSPSSSTAPSRCGRCGSSRGSRTARFALISKTHHCADRRHQRRRPRDGAVRPRPRCRADVAAPRRAVAAATRADRRRAARRRASPGWRGAGVRRRGAARSARVAQPGERSRGVREARRGPRRDRLGRAEPGARRRR